MAFTEPLIAVKKPLHRHFSRLFFITTVKSGCQIPICWSGVIIPLQWASCNFHTSAVIICWKEPPSIPLLRIFLILPLQHESWYMNPHPSGWRLTPSPLGTGEGLSPSFVLIESTHLRMLNTQEDGGPKAFAPKGRRWPSAVRSDEGSYHYPIPHPFFRIRKS